MEGRWLKTQSKSALLGKKKKKKKCIVDLVQAPRQSIHCTNSEAYGSEADGSFSMSLWVIIFPIVLILQKKEETMSLTGSK